MGTSSADYHCTTLPDPLTRSYRRIMKPRLPRKVTASARINLNRFWNELEEFYNRYDQRKEKPVVRLPDYTTDSWDHDREAAENQLNESFGKYHQLCKDVTGFMEKTLSNELKEKYKRLPGKMLKMHDILKEDIMDLRSTFRECLQF